MGKSRRVEKKVLPSQWIDFCWQPDIAKKIALLTKTSSPIATNIVAADIQNQLESLLLTNQEVFDKSEFLLPLTPTTTKQYESLFTKVKNLS